MAEESVDLVAKAESLERKGKFAKAADYFIKAGFPERAAATYEKGCDYKKAQELYLEAGKSDDAERCGEKLRKSQKYESFEEEQSKFQQDFGNPY